LKPDGTNYTAAAGAADITSDIIDMQGYDGIRFVEGFGTITAGAVTSLKVQQGAAATMSDGADLAGTGQTVADTDDGKMFISEIYRPQERYLRVITKRATQNAVVDFLIAELYAPRVTPVAQDATVGGTQEIVSGPLEGTA
jgi:hypothetical protein